MTSLEIERVTGVPGARRWHAVNEASLAQDHVGLPADPLEELLPSLAGEIGGARYELWLGCAGEAPAAALKVELPLMDNTGAALLELYVHPDHRRCGHGRRMLAHALDRARANDRTLAITEIGTALDGSTLSPGERLAESVGATSALSEIRRLLDVPAVDPAALAGLRADAAKHSPGYTLLQWVDHAPPELHEDMAVLEARMSTDVPLGDLAWEPETWTAERYRIKEQTSLARGRNRAATAVRHDASGRLVGFTDIGVNTRRREIAYQWETIVIHEHRGHRLGLLLKVANLELLRAELPGVRYINTWNAAVNVHMIAINDAMGFRPVDRWNGWQLAL